MNLLHQSHGFDGVGEDGGFKSGYCIKKLKRNISDH
jgi:hypothetical protein